MEPTQETPKKPKFKLRLRSGSTQAFLWTLAAVATCGLVYAFRCHHKNYSRPFKIEGELDAKNPTDHYVVCLDCGKRIPYDWEKMKLVVGVDYEAQAC